MSYCINFITNKLFSPEDIFKKLADYGLRIMVTSDEFPSVKLGILEESLRGIEINKEDKGYKVRICSCSSHADYYLFAKTIIAMQEITGETGFSDDGEQISTPHTTLNEEWIERENKSSWDVVRAFIKQYRTIVVLKGMFEDICIGPKMLANYKISLFPPYHDETEKWVKLTQYLTIIQWRLADLKSTNSNLVVRDNNNNQLEVSLISIKDNKVQYFDYVSHAPLLGIVNLDTEESLIIPFKDFRKATHIAEFETSFSAFDECQLIICPKVNSNGEISIKEITDIIKIAERYEYEDYVTKPTIPGSGFNEKQNTFIFIWNTETSNITIEEYIDSIKYFYIGHYERKIHDWKEAKIGDRFYVIKVGEDNVGIVMAGKFSSHPFIASNWSEKGKKPYMIELEPSFMINPETMPLLTIEELSTAIPNFMWRGGYSGRKLEIDQAKTLENVFSNYLKTIKGKDDGINMCMIEVL